MVAQDRPAPATYRAVVVRSDPTEGEPVTRLAYLLGPRRGRLDVVVDHATAGALALLAGLLLARGAS